MRLSIHVLTAALTLIVAASPALAQSSRLSTVDNQQEVNPLTNPEGDTFGSRIAAGDFNGDGIDDLFIRGFGVQKARILLGRSWTIGQSQSPIPFLRSTQTVAYGTNHAVGDFNGDGRDEIAVGYPSDPAGGTTRGSVSIIGRAPNGIWSTLETIRIGSSGYTGMPGNGDALGASLASGDFDNDGFDDLAIGASGRAAILLEGAGAVLVVYGSSSGIGPARSKLFARGNDGLGVASEEGDRYGSKVAVADFTRDGFDDLVIGIPDARCANGTRSGGAVILRGSSNGITNSQSRGYFPGEQGVPGACTSSTQDFGSALATGRFNDDSLPDLAIGAPGLSTSADKGSVTVLASSIIGPGPDASRYIRGIDLPIPPAAGATIGGILASGNLFGTVTRESLVIASADDSAEGVEGAGSFWILHPSTAGLSVTRSERWTLRAPLTLAPAAIDDRFGAAFGIGDFNGDGDADLAVGISKDDTAGVDAGAVQIIYQSEFIFRDGFQ